MLWVIFAIAIVVVIGLIVCAFVKPSERQPCSTDWSGYCRQHDWGDPNCDQWGGGAKQDEEIEQK